MLAVIGELERQEETALAIKVRSLRDNFFWVFQLMSRFSSSLV